MAHITGGGVIENLPRILPAGMGAQIGRRLPEPPIFALIQQEGHISTEEMFRVFNMGIGMLVVIEPTQTAHALNLLADNGDGDAAGGACEIGSINDKSGVKIYMEDPA